MNKKTFLLVAAVLIAGMGAWAVPPAKPPAPPKAPKPKPGGTDILHLFLRKNMTSEDLVPNATGRVDLGLNRQGNAFNQRLDITTANLPTNTTWLLWAAMGEDTNFTYAGSFTTGSKGRGLVRFMKVGSSNGQAVGKGKTPLPAELDPVSDIRTLVVANVNTQAVLTAELREPEKLQYLVKRALSHQEAQAALRLKATTAKVQFHLLAAGLAPATDYYLAVNENVVAGASSGTNGVLAFTNLPVAATDILHVRRLAVWDGDTNCVLGTALP